MVSNETDIGDSMSWLRPYSLALDSVRIAEKESLGPVKCLGLMCATSSPPSSPTGELLLGAAACAATSHPPSPNLSSELGELMCGIVTA